MAKKRSTSITGIEEINKFLQNNDMKKNKKHRKSLPANFIPRSEQQKQDEGSGWVIEKITNYKFFPTENTLKFLGKWYSEGREDYDYKPSYLEYHQIKGNSILKQWAINNSHINKYKTNWIVKFNYFDRFPNCTMVCLHTDCTIQNIPTTQLCEVHKCRITKCNNEHNKKSNLCDKHWRQKQHEKKTKAKNDKKINNHQSQNVSPIIKTRAQKQATKKAQTQIHSPTNPKQISSILSSKTQSFDTEFNGIEQFNIDQTTLENDQPMSQLSIVFPQILPPSPLKNRNNYTPSPPNSLSSMRSTKSYEPHIDHITKTMRTSPNTSKSTEPRTHPTKKKKKNKMKSTVKIDKTLSKLQLDMEFDKSIWNSKNC